MKKLLTTLFLFSLSILSSFAQRNYNQELVDLLEEGRCFEAREFRMQYADELDLNDETLNLLYKVEMAQFFNKSDSAAFYLIDLVTNHESTFGLGVGSLYGKLLSIYDDSQQFEKGIELCDQIIDYFNRNPFDLEEDLVQNEINFVENVKTSLKDRMENEPLIRIDRNKSSEGNEIKLNDGEFILFNANYNGIPIETMFDTGVTFHFVITKDLADEIGVRVVNKTDTLGLLNDVPTKGYKGIIDSIDIGEIKLYNIPTLVLNESFVKNLPDTLNDDSRLEIEAALHDKQIIIGLPTMKMIGKMEFDWVKRTLSFPKDIEKRSPNLYLAGKDLHIRMKINGVGHSGYLDTGDNDLLSMPFSFYEKNKNHLEIDSIAYKKPLNIYQLTGPVFNIPYEIVKDPKIYFNNKHIDQDELRVTVSDEVSSHLNVFDGLVGVHFLKRLGPKVILDFDNMRIEGKD